jgi:hypothetical protein
MVQLATRIEGVDRPLGDPVPGEGLRAHLGQPIRPSAADPGDIDYAIAYRPDLLNVIWPVGESGWQEVVIPEAIPNLNPCGVCPCEQVCIDDVGGLARWQLAHVVDGELWLAWTQDIDNTTYFQSEYMDGQGCHCWVEAWGGQSTSSFHLTRIDIDEGSYEHVLAMDFPIHILRLDIHAWERRLGVRLYLNENGTRTVRALGLDLDAF